MYSEFSNEIILQRVVHIIFKYFNNCIKILLNDNEI